MGIGNQSSPGMVDRSNNFDFIRLMAALMVIVWHSATLTGHQSFDPLFALSHGQENLGHLGVAIFFVTSGSLILAAWERDPNPARFVANRILRILPALIVAMLFCVLVVGPIATNYSWKDYFCNSETWSFLWRNISLVHLQWNLPGCFQQNPFPTGVNGSLWTIPHEVTCYLLVLSLGLTGFLFYRFLPFLMGLPLVGFIYAVHVGQSWVLPDHVLGLNAKDFLQLGGFFVGGMVMHSLRSAWTPRLDVATALLAILLLSMRFYTADLVAPLVLPYLVYYAAYSNEFRLTNFGRYGDFSYGAYLFAFPIQQLLAQAGCGPFARLTVLHAIVSTGLTLMLAFVSWRVVEAPALRLKRAPLWKAAFWSRLEACAFPGLAFMRIGESIQRRPLVALVASLACVLLMVHFIRVSVPSRIDFSSSAKYALFGAWQPKGEGEKYQWVDREGGVLITKPAGAGRMFLSGFVPDRFTEVTLLTIEIMSGSEIRQYETFHRPATATSWQLEYTLQTPQLESGIYKVTVRFNSTHIPQAEAKDQRHLSGLISNIEFR